MGRFSEKYPAEAKALLYELMLDASPPRTLAEALADVDERLGVEINPGTAKGYVRAERRRREAETFAQFADRRPREALNMLARGRIAALERLSNEVDAARSMPLEKRVDLNVRIARGIKELQAAQPSHEPRGQDDVQPESNGRHGDEQRDEDGHSPFVKRLLADAAARMTNVADPPGDAPGPVDEDDGAASPVVDRDARITGLHAQVAEQYPRHPIGAADGNPPG